MTKPNPQSPPAFHDGCIAIREYLSLTLDFDHDIVDGGPAARFAQHFKDLIERGYGLDDRQSVQTLR